MSKILLLSETFEFLQRGTCKEKQQQKNPARMENRFIIWKDLRLKFDFQIEAPLKTIVYRDWFQNLSPM